MSWDHPSPFIHRVCVQRDDIDRMQHVNNARYLQYLEDAAWAHTLHLGMSWEQFEALNCGVVAYRTEVDYLQPAVLNDQLEVATWCSGNDGKLRLERSYQIRRPADDCKIVNAKTQWICVDLKTGKPRRMPAEFVETYRAGKGANRS